MNTSKIYLQSEKKNSFFHNQLAWFLKPASSLWALSKSLTSNTGLNINKYKYYGTWDANYRYIDRMTTSWYLCIYVWGVWKCYSGQDDPLSLFLSPRVCTPSDPTHSSLLQADGWQMVGQWSESWQMLGRWLVDSWQMIGRWLADGW